MDELARLATADDLGDLAALASMAANEVAEIKGGARYLTREARFEPYETSLKTSIEHPTEAVFVGTIDAVPVGFSAVRLEELRTGEVIAEMTEIFVMPEARGVSIGELMLDEVLEWARGHNAVALEGVVHPGNRDAKNFFERAGMVTRLLRVSTVLDNPEPK